MNLRHSGFVAFAKLQIAGGKHTKITRWPEEPQVESIGAVSPSATIKLPEKRHNDRPRPVYYIIYNVCGAAIGLRRSLFYIFLADAIGITRRQFTASAASLARMGKLSSKAKELQQFLGSFDR